MCRAGARAGIGACERGPAHESADPSPLFSLTATATVTARPARAGRTAETTLEARAVCMVAGGGGGGECG